MFKFRSQNEHFTDLYLKYSDIHIPTLYIIEYI